MSTNAAFSGVSLGVVFCMISAGFDVYVANVIQEVNPAIFIIYCFILSTLVFSIISSVKKDRGITSLKRRRILATYF
ncbi:hypothetical protein MAY82_17795 [Edwardsiella ictaluri]|nr:hypothetical protein [Edwardsiella ictaluri]WFO12792.1 hypothetical protein MAY82_17795 [Edwardsiella ictaluri]